jgi:ribosome-associated translation inhibitor RaiA
MTIQINTDNNISVHEEFGKKLENILSEGLSRFIEHITRLEVHLSDDNGSKDKINDKRCLLEARLEGRQPTVVTGFGNNYELAVDNAVDKLKSSLDTILGKLRNHYTHFGADR